MFPKRGGKKKHLTTGRVFIVFFIIILAGDKAEEKRGERSM